MGRRARGVPRGHAREGDRAQPGEGGDPGGGGILLRRRSQGRAVRGLWRRRRRLRRRNRRMGFSGRRRRGRVRGQDRDGNRGVRRHRGQVPRQSGEGRGGIRPRRRRRLRGGRGRRDTQPRDTVRDAVLRHREDLHQGWRRRARDGGVSERGFRRARRPVRGQRRQRRRHLLRGGRGHQLVGGFPQEGTSSRGGWRERRGQEDARERRAGPHRAGPPRHSREKRGHRGGHRRDVRARAQGDDRTGRPGRSR
mmetsp:Transcript_1052/g.4704  ORF Transcript_1052/g.4704 Transcript_1052/m.4704 type:complete len:251 (+) Transcript_1052:509-1261(+)